MRTTVLPVRYLAQLLGALGACCALSAGAGPLPASSFSYDVYAGAASICTSGTQAVDGTCSYDTATQGGFSQASGGVPGTPGFDGLPGTNVYSSASMDPIAGLAAFRLGGGVTTITTMTYYFSVSGPADFVPVDIYSTGAVAVSGSGFASVSLLVQDMGSDSGVLGPDPESPNPLDFRTALADTWTPGGIGNWSARDNRCVVTGDLYRITIQASASVNKAGSSSTASLDPYLAVDPPPEQAPVNCSAPPDLTAYTLSVSPGASTGFAVPEPGTLALAGLALLLIGAGRHLNRRRR